MAELAIDDFLDRDGMFREDAEPPASLGACVDLYHEVKELRLQMEKQLAGGVKALENALKEHLIANLSKSDDTGIAGRKYRAQVVTARKIKVADWGVFHSWIRKNDRFDMLQKRIAETAASDWVDQEKRLLPGTEIINVPDLSVRKI